MLDVVFVMLGIGDGIGLNFWVVFGDYMVFGKLLLVNDLYFGFVIFSIWY